MADIIDKGSKIKVVRDDDAFIINYYDKVGLSVSGAKEGGDKGSLLLTTAEGLVVETIAFEDFNSPSGNTLQEIVDDVFNIISTVPLTSNGADLGAIYGADTLWVSASEVKIGLSNNTSLAKDYKNTLDIEWTNFISIDITASGKNGLQEDLTEANSTWYVVHVIADSLGVNEVAGMLSTSMTDPLLPSGYDKFRRIGWVRNNRSGDILKFSGCGYGNRKHYHYDVTATDLIVLSGGSATVLTTVDASALVPSTAVSVIGNFDFENTGGGATDEFVLAHAGSRVEIAALPYRYRPGVTVASCREDFQFLVNSSGEFEYAVTNANDSLTIALVGFYDNV